MSPVIEERRLKSLCVTPQALAFEGSNLWLSSRDLGKLYRVDAANWKVLDELQPPEVVWAAVAMGDELRCTIGLGANDDRYVFRYSKAGSFEKLFACPDFAGSYLSFDGSYLYLSQWYLGKILRIDDSGTISRTISAGEEICGHTFYNGRLYILRGKENAKVPDATEEWRIARLDLKEETPVIQDLATIPFASRSLTHDGTYFWSNHRAANETIAFSLPA